MEWTVNSNTMCVTQRGMQFIVSNFIALLKRLKWVKVRVLTIHGQSFNQSTRAHVIFQGSLQGKGILLTLPITGDEKVEPSRNR